MLILWIAVACSRWAARADAAQPAQKVHRAGFKLASEEAFSVVTAFFDSDASLPLDGRTVDKWESEEARFEKIVYTSQSGERVPGELALPKQGAATIPCVLLLHGLGNSKERWWREDQKALPKGLLEAGIAVFTIDLALHGERSARNDYQSPVFLTMGNSLFVRNRDMVIESTIDSRRALAYLRTRGDVEGGRLGVAGYSMGGMIALYLSALEADLAAVVVSAVPTTEQPLPIDHFNFAARARTPVLLQIGRKDWLSSPEDARMLFDLLPLEERRLEFYDAGHTLPAQFATDAATWLIGTLKRSSGPLGREYPSGLDAGRAGRRRCTLDSNPSYPGNF
jgi:pimeloyl-ACP methyl ester carboxylesterase